MKQRCDACDSVHLVIEEESNVALKCPVCDREYCQGGFKYVETVETLGVPLELVNHGQPGESYKFKTPAGQNEYISDLRKVRERIRALREE